MSSGQRSSMRVSSRKANNRAPRRALSHASGSLRPSTCAPGGLRSSSPASAAVNSKSWRLCPKGITRKNKDNRGGNEMQLYSDLPILNPCAPYSKQPKSVLHRRLQKAQLAAKQIGYHLEQRKEAQTPASPHVCETGQAPHIMETQKESPQASAKLPPADQSAERPAAASRTSEMVIRMVFSHPPPLCLSSMQFWH